MRYLIQTVTARRDGSSDYDDADYRGDAISIGQATDQDIQLAEPSVAPQHALIALRAAGKFRLRALTATPVTVNGKAVRSADLKVGDVIEIGASRIELLPAPSGFDLALQLTRAAADAEHNRYRLQSTRLSQTGLSKRRWSWALGGGFLLFGLLLPFAGALIEPLQQVLHDTPLPSDRQWLSGPLQAAHRTPEIRDNCQVCHATPFVSVKNEQCVACHASTGQHVDPDVQQIAELHQADCAGCHREHNEPSGAVAADQRLCSDCHDDLEDNTGVTSDFANVSDFGDAHPPFKVTLLVPPDEPLAQPWPTERLALADGLTERSNLRFDHQAHLQPDGVRGPDGTEVMACGDCHQVDAGGEYVMPITMEQHCQRCHSLSFDPDYPERQVPHATPDVVVQTLEEYFSRKFLEQTLGRATEPTGDGRLGRVRRPGRPLDDRQRGEILTLARASAGATEGLLFTAESELVVKRSRCVTCHEVNQDSAAADAKPADQAAAGGAAETDGAPLSRWQVRPVKLTQRWMPHAVFSHDSHRLGMRLTDADGQTTKDCAVCHAAEQSDQAADVLMPDIQTCRGCHSGQHGDGVASGCASCHDFHLSGRGVMR